MLEIINMYVQKVRFGRPTYLNSNEESLVVVSTEIEGDHGMTIDVNKLDLVQPKTSPSLSFSGM